MSDALLEAVRGLRVAEPDLGFKPLLAKLREQQPDLGAGTKEVRVALAALKAESEAAKVAPRLRPARRTVAGWCPDMCELVWGEPGTFVKKRRVRRKHPL